MAREKEDEEEKVIVSNGEEASESEGVKTVRDETRHWEEGKEKRRIKRQDFEQDKEEDLAEEDLAKEDDSDVNDRTSSC